MRGSTHKVTAKEHGLSLLAFLKHTFFEGCSVKFIKKFVEQKGCRVNGRVILFPSHKLMKEDIVELSLVENQQDVNKPCQTIYEDQDLLVIDKPAGLVCDPSFVIPYVARGQNLYLIHRLDKDTSGLLMLAKNEPFFAAMKNLFSKQGVQKFYLAFIDGKMERDKGAIVSFLAQKGSYCGQTLYGSVEEEKGKRAQTFFSVLAKKDTVSLVLLSPRTGRTHQLRVHMKERGHPIIGDHQYARQFMCSVPASRHMLHAYALSFTHPVSKNELFFVSPPPTDFDLFAQKCHVSLSCISSLCDLPSVLKRVC